MLFDNSLEEDEGFFDLRFLFQRIEPGVSGEMIDKYEVVFEIVDRENWGGPNISV